MKQRGFATELAISALKNGIAFEIVWMSENLKTHGGTGVEGGPG
jgi:hypothetical protein